MPEFNGLTGSEVAELVLKDVRRVLDRDTSFAQHVTYPRIKWTVTIEFEAYPRDKPKFAAVAEGAHTDPGFKAEPGELSTRIVVDGEGPHVGAMEKLNPETPGHLTGHLVPTGPAPDEVRVAENMPVSRRRTVRNVGTVDAPAAR